MLVENTPIKDLLVITPSIFVDRRGSFMETYNEPTFKAKGIPYTFVQDNQSKSSKGVLRGLHYQINYPQAKLLRAVTGSIFDVAVDLRKNSPTYGRWFGITLSAENRKMLMIPRGFAHGFLALSDNVIVNYKCDDIYHPNDEGGIIWNDPDIGIQWPDVGDIILSDKDSKHPTLRAAHISFDL